MSFVQLLPLLKFVLSDMVVNTLVRGNKCCVVQRVVVDMTSSPVAEVPSRPLQLTAVVDRLGATPPHIPLEVCYIIRLSLGFSNVETPHQI